MSDPARSGAFTRSDAAAAAAALAAAEAAAPARSWGLTATDSQLSAMFMNIAGLPRLPDTGDSGAVREFRRLFMAAVETHLGIDIAILERAPPASDPEGTMLNRRLKGLG